MRRPLTIGVGFSMLATSVGAEGRIAVFDEATVRPPDTCVEYIANELYDTIGDAIQVNIELSTTADKPTSNESRERDQFSQETGLVPIESYLQRLNHFSSYVLPKSGMHIVVASDYDWAFYPDRYENVLEKALRTDVEGDPLQSTTNECLADLIFERRALNHTPPLNLFILGSGDRKLSTDNVGIFDPKSTQGQVIGRYYNKFHGISNVALVTPTTTGSRDPEINGSSTVVHETMHHINDALGVEHADPKAEEYGAFGLGAAALDLLSTEPQAPIIELVGNSQ